MHPVFFLVTGILALLGGLQLMRSNLQKMLGTSLQRLLTQLTLTPGRGFVTGIIAAALLQSSTAVSLITIALTSAGCLSFQQGFGLILGANIGTCSTVQVLAVAGGDQSITTLLSFLLLFALLALIPILRKASLALGGLCAMLLGIAILAKGFEQVTELETIIYYLKLAEQQPLYGITGGILLTGLLNSSSAATGILMLVADDGMLNLTTAIYVIYGNNIGSCLSSIIVGIGSPPAAKQVALSHILLNIIGTLVFFPFTHILASAIAGLTTDFALQVAFAHTAFNVLSSVLALPATKPFTWLITSLVPNEKSIKYKLNR